MPRPVQSLSARAARHGGWLSNLALSLVLALLGWTAVQWRELLWPRHGAEIIDWQEMGMEWFQRTSYDLPFVVRQILPLPQGSPRSTDAVVLIYMDEESTRALQLPPNAPWSRTIHARLLDRLTAEQARAVIFDLVFDSETDADPVFAAALTRNGHSYLGATFSSNNNAADTRDTAGTPGLFVEQPTRRPAPHYPAARGWGLLTFRPIDGDYGVRRLFPGKERAGLPPFPGIMWKVARDLGASLPDDAFRPRWLNYFGPVGSIENFSYHRVLDPQGGVLPGSFRDRIVIVGANSQLASTTERPLDAFSTPWSQFQGRRFTPGAEIHATALLNLLQHDWLERVPPAYEKILVVVLGLALGGLRWLRPWRAFGVVLLAAGALLAASCLLQWHGRLWWNWAVPVVLQLPCALVLAVASRYYVEEARKRKLRSAFGFYLSPDLANEIAERNFPLAPGGEKVVATLVFTDLEGFTTLSEKLGDSARLGAVLTDYFTRTTDEILREKGTVIKFIGDAVYAAWGAPLPQPDHAERAVRAAWRLSQVSEMDVPIPQPDGSTASVHVRTRVGIHTGEALAGNLGSARRFDYTLIGDTTNLASRLEGINKQLGTTILLSDETAAQLGGRFLLRRLGAFRVVGRAQAVVIHELLGEAPAPLPDWVATFEAGLAAWAKADFTTAGQHFEAVKQQRGGTDGPSQFYLARIGPATVPANWTGEVQLQEK
jgi:adenylate cyclase